MTPAVKRAVQIIMQEIGKAEGGAMEAMRAPPAGPEVGAETGEAEECPECAAGTCDNPDHMAPEEMDGLAAEME